MQKSFSQLSEATRTAIAEMREKLSKETDNITPTVYYTLAKQKNFSTADAKQLLEKHGGDFAAAYAELKTI